MKFLSTKTALSFLLVIIILASPVLASAQFDNFPDNGNPDAPIDGGLSLLVAAGVGYGAKKLKEKRNKQSAESVKG